MLGIPRVYLDIFTPGIYAKTAPRFFVTYNQITTTKMGMNKNGIFAWASFFTLLIGIALVLLGVLKYQDYAIGFSTVGIGFFVMSWAFNALKGRV